MQKFAAGADDDVPQGGQHTSHVASSVSSPCWDYYCQQEEKVQLEQDAAHAAAVSAAEHSALMQRLDATTAELDAAHAKVEATAALLVEAAEARDRAQQECAEHAEYQESLEGVAHWHPTVPADAADHSGGM